MKTKEVIKILEDNKITNVVKNTREGGRLGLIRDTTKGAFKTKSKEKIMPITKEAMEKRKVELQKQHDDLSIKINQGKEAMRSMDAQLILVTGAVQQCDFFLNMEKKDVKDK